MLGLAGMLLMASADTKDVEATGKISYESENVQEDTVRTAGLEAAACSLAVEEKAVWEEAEGAAAEMPAETAAEMPAETVAEMPAEIPAEAEARLEEGMEEAEPTEADSGRVYELSEEDYDALLRLVEAEASGEDIKGKMLVANVVLNRVESSSFPDTVKEVIYQRHNGRAQFSPVATGKIDRVAVSEETVEAVERALCGEDESCGALYFVAPAYADAANHRWFQKNLTWLFSYNGHEFYTVNHF